MKKTIFIALLLLLSTFMAFGQIQWIDVNVRTQPTRPQFQWVQPRSNQQELQQLHEQRLQMLGRQHQHNMLMIDMEAQKQQQKQQQQRREEEQHRQRQHEREMLLLQQKHEREMEEMRQRTRMVEGQESQEIKEVQLQEFQPPVKSQSTLITMKYAAVYQEPNLVSEKLFRIPPGISVQILEKVDAFYKIEYNRKIGYVHVQIFED